MIRIVIENIVLFFLPTLIYVTYIALTREEKQQGLLDDAPLAWLAVAGTVVVVVVLVAFGSTSGGRPDQHYEPPSLKDGKIQPGQIR
jgi:Family of unknown function (DUF6111)